MRHAGAWALVPVVALALAGCSKSSAPPMAPSSMAAFSVTPADGAAGVRLDAPVTLRFGRTVDRATVEGGFHLISEYDMTQGPCPDSTMAPHGTMSAMMADSAMMAHLDRDHSTAGTFAWDPAGTQCTFQPSAWMRPVTRYMVHVDGAVTRMMDSLAMPMGSWSGHGSGSMSGHMMFHFTTLDTTGGGHDGHH